MTCGREGRLRGSCTPCRSASRPPAIPVVLLVRERVGDGVEGLFLLAKRTAADLEAAAQAGGSCLIAATAHGGPSPRPAVPMPISSRATAGSRGWSRRFAREWPIVRCRSVNLALSEDAGILAGRLADEVFVGDGWAEVGYDRGRRIRLHTVEQSLRPTNAAIELNPGDPVVITGGHRGITALVAAELRAHLAADAPDRRHHPGAR